MEMKNIDQILRTFRDDLPHHSQTAAAIDRGASLEEISELAEEEGLHKLASVLFEAEQEALREGVEAVEDPAEGDRFVPPTRSARNCRTTAGRPRPSIAALRGRKSPKSPKKKDCTRSPRCCSKPSRSSCAPPERRGAAAVVSPPGAAGFLHNAPFCPPARRWLPRSPPPRFRDEL